MKGMMSLEDYNTYYKFILPRARKMLTRPEMQERDVLTYDAPVLILFHAEKGTECHSENIFINLTYGLLAAHAMGLGATAIGLVPRAIKMAPFLKKSFNIPRNHVILTSMIVGYPKYEYQRTIKRPMKVNWI